MGNPGLRTWTCMSVTLSERPRWAGLLWEKGQGLREWRQGMPWGKQGTAACEAACTTAGKAGATAGAGIGGRAMGAAAGESVAGSGARESTAPAVAGKGAAGAAVREETAEATKTEGGAAAEATVAIARPLGAAGAAARVVEATAGLIITSTSPPSGAPSSFEGGSQGLDLLCRAVHPEAAHSCPHPQGSPRAPRGAARALAFLAEPCSPTPKSTQSSPVNLLPPPPPSPPPPGATHISKVEASLWPHLSPTCYKDPNHPSRHTSPTLSPNGLPSSHHTPQAAKSHPQGPVEPHGSDDTLEGPTGGATSGRGAGPNFQHGGATSNTPLPLIPPPTATSEPPQTSLGGAGSGDIGAGGVGGVPIRGVLGGGEVIVRDEDAVEDGMHIDGPLAQYLTPDGEADPMPHDEVPPFPPMPDPMLADGPMEGLEENLRTEPLRGAPILTPHPPAHSPPRAPHPRPHPQGLPVASRGAAKALAFLAEPRPARRARGHSEGRASHTQPHPCLSPLLAPFLSPKSSTLPPPPSGAPSSITGSSQGPGLLRGAGGDDTMGAGPTGGAATLRPPPTPPAYSLPHHEWPRWADIAPQIQPTTEGDVMGRGGMHTELPLSSQPPILPSPIPLASQPALPSQPDRDNQNQVGRRRKKKGKGGKGPAHLLPPPSLPLQPPLLTSHPTEPAPGPTPICQPPNSHPPPVPAPPQGHGSDPTYSPPGRLSLPLNPPQVAAAACAAGMEADGMRDAPMADATDSSSHTSHPIQVDAPLPQPMVIGEGQGGFIEQEPHVSTAQPARPAPPTTRPALLPSPALRLPPPYQSHRRVTPVPDGDRPGSEAVSLAGDPARPLAHDCHRSTGLPLYARLRQPQTAARLLSACVSTRPQYLSRTVPPSPAVLCSFARWDARLGETFQQLLASGTWACREDVKDAASDQIFLPIRLGGFGIRRMERIAPSFASGETEQIDPSLRTTLEGLPPDILSLLPPWPSCASASPDSLFAGASRLLEAHALEARAEAGQPGGGAQWGQHQLRGQVARGAGGQRGRQGVQTSQGGEGGQQRRQQESQHRSRAQGAAPQGVGSGVGQGREQQRADGGTGGAGSLGGEVLGVREAAGDRAGGLGGLGEGREGEGRGQVGGGEDRGRETTGEEAPRDQTGQQPAQQQGPAGRTGRAGTSSRITDLTCRDVGQSMMMVLVDVSIADPQREGNVQLRRATPTQIGVAAARRVQEKLRHWGPHLEGLQPAPQFYACVAETFGLPSEPLCQFLGLCAKRIAQRSRDWGGGDDRSARIFETGLTTRLSVALQRAQAQCILQHASHPLPPHAIRSPRPYPPRACSLAASFDPPCPPRRYPPLAIRSSPPVPSPRLPSPPPSPPLLHASSFRSLTHSTPCPSSIRTLPLVSRPPMLGFSPPCPSPPFSAPHLPPLPAPPLSSTCPWLPTSLPHLSPFPASPSSPPCPSFSAPPRPVSPLPAPPFLSPCLSFAPSLPPPAHAPVFGFSPPCPTFLPSLRSPCTPSAPPLFSPHPLLLPSLPLISRIPALVSYHPCPSFPLVFFVRSPSSLPAPPFLPPCPLLSPHYAPFSPSLLPSYHHQPPPSSGCVNSAAQQDAEPLSTAPTRTHTRKTKSHKKTQVPDPNLGNTADPTPTGKAGGTAKAVGGAARDVVKAARDAAGAAGVAVGPAKDVLGAAEAPEGGTPGGVTMDVEEADAGGAAGTTREVAHATAEAAENAARVAEAAVVTERTAQRGAEAAGRAAGAAAGTAAPESVGTAAIRAAEAAEERAAYMSGTAGTARAAVAAQATEGAAEAAAGGGEATVVAAGAASGAASAAAGAADAPQRALGAATEAAGPESATAGAAETAVDRAAGTDGTSRIAREARAAGVAQATARAAEYTAGVAQAPAGMAGAADKAAEAAGRTLRAVSGGAGPVAEGAAPGLVGVVAEETGRAAAHQAAGDKAAAAAVVGAAEAPAVAGGSAADAAAGGAVAEKGGVVGIAAEATAVVSAAGGSAAGGRTAGATTGERAGGAELGESVAGAGAPAAAGEGAAGAAAGEGTAEAAQTDEGAASAAAAGAAAGATEGTMARPAGAAEAAAGAVEATAGPTEAVSGAEEAAERAGSKEPAGGAGSGDIGAGGVGGVPTRGVLGGGDVVVMDEDAVEDLMHIDGPLAQYLTPDGEADPMPHDEVPPFPPMPDPMLADGPLEGLEENLRTEPLVGAPILTPHPPAHPPPKSTTSPPPPSGTTSQGGDDTMGAGPTGGAASGRGSGANLQHGGTTSEPHSPPNPPPSTTQPPQTSLPPSQAPRPNRYIAPALRPPPTTPAYSLPHHEWPRWADIAPHIQPSTEGDVMGRGGMHTELPLSSQPPILPSPIPLASQPALPSQPDRDNQNQVGRRRKKKGKGGKGPAHLLPPPSLPLQPPLLTPHPTESVPGPTPTGQPPNSHPPLVPAPPQGHGSDPAHPPLGRLSLPINPPQVAAAGMEADRMRDAPMADATDSPSHASHPIHVDAPLPQPMVFGEGKGGFLGQGPHPSSAQPTRPTPPSTLPALLPSPAGRQVTGTPQEVRGAISDLLAIRSPSSSPAAPTLSIPQVRTRTYAEVTRSVPSFIPPTTHPGASLPSPMETDLVPRPCRSHLDVVAPPPVQPVAETQPVAQEGTGIRDEASAPAQTPPPGATHGAPSTASSDATAPIDPTDTATSPDQVVRCPTCRSSLANRRALQHHTPFCHPADAARRAQALHDTSSVLPSLSEPQGTRTHFTDAQWQTLESFDWTEYFSPERTHARPLRRIPARVRGGYLDVLCTILARVSQDPEAPGPTFLLAAAPTLLLTQATPPDRSHTTAIAARVSRFMRGEWTELLSEALIRRTPLPRRTSRRARAVATHSTADERRIARCLRLAACNETSRACAALESAEAAPDTQGTTQRLKSKHPNAERPTPAWLSDYQGTALVLSTDHLRRAIFTAPRGSSGGPSSTRPHYLSRTVPPSPVVLSSFARWDARLGETFQQLLASGTWACREVVRDAASDQIFLPIRIGGFGIRRMERIAPSFTSGETEQIDPSLRTTLEGLPPDILSLLPLWPSCASASPDSLFAGASRLLEAHALEAPVVGEGTRARRPLEQRAEAGQPGGGAQWGQHQLRGRVARGAGGQRQRQGVQTSQSGEGGQQRQQQESQHRSQAQGAAPQGVGSGMRQGREQQRADGGTGGAGRLGGQQPAQQQGPAGRTGRAGTSSRIPDLTCRDVGQTLMVLVDVSLADPQREGNVQLGRATPTQIGVVAARRVQEKLRHWGPHFEGLQPAPHFYACVAETFGLPSEPLRQFLGLCAKRIAQRMRDWGGGDDGSARIFETGLTTRLSVALQCAQAQCILQHASHPLPPHAICSPRPYPPRARSLVVSFDPPCPPRRYPPLAIRSSPPVPSPRLPSPPPSPPLLHASSFPSLTHSTPCPSSIRTLPLVSRPPMLASPLPASPSSPPPTPGFSPHCNSLSFSVPLLCSLPAPACPCPCLWFLPSLPHVSSLPEITLYPLCPSLVFPAPIASPLPALDFPHPCPCFLPSMPLVSPLCTFTLFPPCPSLPPPLPFAFPSPCPLLPYPVAAPPLAPSTPLPPVHPTPVQPPPPSPGCPFPLSTPAIVTSREVTQPNTALAHLEAHVLEAVRARHTSPLHLARWTSLQGVDAGAWLQAVPYADALRIPEAQWQVASSCRLGLPVPQLALTAAVKGVAGVAGVAGMAGVAGVAGMAGVEEVAGEAAAAPLHATDRPRPASPPVNEPADPQTH
ncbi:unnamed protein product [Closterium sp. Naga37s-1]|nr:unnamed protein product [Closterium sp. Naga37s-1]